MASGGWALFRRGRFALFFLAAGLFAALTFLALVVQIGGLAGLDTAVAEWFGEHRTRARYSEAKAIFLFVGQPVYVGIAALVCGTMLSLHARSPMPAVAVTGALGASVLVEKSFKALVEHHHNYFPSGHVAGSAALLGMIAVCLGVGRSRAVKVALAVPVVAGVLFVAFVALYAEYHVFTDVIGGMLLGGAVVALGAAVLGATNYSRRDSAVASTDDPSPSYT